MAKNFKWIVLGIIGLLLAGSALSLVWIFYHPNILLRPHLIRSYLERSGLSSQIQYNDLELSLQTLSAFSRRLSVSGSQICIEHLPVVKTCAKRAVLDIEFTFGLSHFELSRVHLIELDIARTDISLKSSPEVKGQKSPTIDLRPVFKILEQTVAPQTKVDIKASDLTIQQSSTSIKTSFRIVGNGNHINLKTNPLEIGSFKSKEIKLTVENNGPKKLRIRLAASQQGRHLNAELDLAQTDTDLAITGQASVYNSHNSNEDFELRQCKIHLNQMLRGDQSATCTFHYLLGLEFKDLVEDQLLPQKVSALVRYHHQSNLIELTLNQIDTSLLRFGGQFLVQNFQPKKIDLMIQVMDTARAIKIYKKRGYPIVAPFHVFGGTMDFALQSENLSKNDIQLNFKLKTNLKSKQQRARIHASGAALYQIKRNRIKTIQVNSQILDLRLVLPRIGTRAPPTLIKDSRIADLSDRSKENQDPRIKSKVQSPQGPKSTVEIENWNFAVTTQKEDSIKLVSNLSKSDIPFALRVDCAPKGCRGFSRTKNVPVSLFKREAKIESLSYQFNDPKNEKSLDGRFKIDYADYTIYAYLSGEPSDPFIRFESSPPLSHQDTIAVLLFGSPMSSLSEENANSASNTSDAITDRALGLASLYYLASTPVESVRYDPQSKIFSAKVALGGGTSFVLGADSQRVRSIGLRKRIGKNFAVTSEIPKDSSTDRSSVTGFLEWFTRY